MKNEEKIVELLSEMLHKFDVLTEEVSSVKNEVSSVKNEVSSVKNEVKNLNNRLGKVEEEIVKLNLATSQNSLSLMRLVEYNDERFSRLEKVVFKL
jgi:septal ring factor EnvC (AmiA/AmiB activator)